jgi:hypothetical protein
MPNLGIWSINQGKPVRVQRTDIQLEKHLEDWIEQNPSLIHFNLTIVGRQMHVDAGYLDLLGLDPFGNWVVIEIKRGNVRRETITQALDYAACIAEMPTKALKAKIEAYLLTRQTSLAATLSDFGLDNEVFDNRTVHVYVVGTGRDEGYERLARFIKNSISIITFDVFVDMNDNITLVREIEELDAQPTSKSPEINTADTVTFEKLLSIAKQNKIGEQFQMIYDVATKYGLYPRLYKWSIMYTPPQHKNRCCVVAWVKPVRGLLKAYAIPETISEFFNISEQEVVDILGFKDRIDLNLSDTKQFCTNLEQLFKRIQENSQ